MSRWPWFKRRPDTLRDTLDHLTTTVNFLVAENAQLREDLAEVAAVVFGPCPQCAVDDDEPGLLRPALERAETRAAFDEVIDDHPELEDLAELEFDEEAP